MFFFDTLIFTLTVGKQKKMFEQEYPGLTPGSTQPCLPETDAQAREADRLMGLGEGGKSAPKVRRS